MPRRARAVLAALLVLGPTVSPARAAYDDVGVSARVTGLSKAYTAVADDVYATYYNPAGLANIDRPEFGTSYSRLLTGLSDGSNIQNSFLAYAHPLDEGRNGVVGAAWNYFTLDGLYRENSLFASYGRRVTREDVASPVFAGASAKFLNRSLGAGTVAGNAINNAGAVQTGVADPALQNTSRTNVDADLGLLWKPQPRWDVGFQVQHLLEPNIAFSAGDSDKLGRNLKFGAAYRTPFMTMAGDVDFNTAPDGSLDKILNVGAEKWLPTLLYGSFAVRGGLGFGSRDYRQVTAGLSYKIHRMQFDYGYAIPVGGLASTSGSHRIGLTWRFGAPRQADALLSEMLLENLAAPAPVGTPEFERQAADLVAYKRKAIDSLMRDADAEAELGRFEDARERARQAASLAPRDAAVTEVAERYRTAAAYFPDISRSLRDPAFAAAEDGLMKFIAGRNNEALVSLDNSRKLIPSPAADGMIRIILAKGGTFTPSAGAPSVPAAPVVVAPPPAAVPAPVVAVSTPAAVPPPAAVAVSSAPSGAEALKRILDSTSALLEVSFFQQEWDKVIKLAGTVIELDPSNENAYKRLAGALHAQKKPAEALKALKAAYALEPDDAERGKLRAYISALKTVVEKQNRPAPTPKPKAAVASPEDVEKLYEAGVELYAQGRLIEAREAFRRCLAIDENYIPAQRAYQRVQAEMMQTGKGQ